MPVNACTDVDPAQIGTQVQMHQPITCVGIPIIKKYRILGSGAIGFPYTLL